MSSEIKRLHELRKILHEADREYYVEADPSLSDYQYDMLMKELIGLEEKHPKEYSKSSPSQVVGGGFSESL